MKAWADLPPEQRARVISGIKGAAVYKLQCLELPALGGMDREDARLLAEVEADLAAMAALGWVDDDHTEARLERARIPSSHRIRKA